MIRKMRRKKAQREIVTDFRARYQLDHRILHRPQGFYIFYIRFSDSWIANEYGEYVGQLLMVGAYLHFRIIVRQNERSRGEECELPTQQKVEFLFWEKKLISRIFKKFPARENSEKKFLAKKMYFLK